MWVPLASGTSPGDMRVGVVTDVIIEVVSFMTGNRNVSVSVPGLQIQWHRYRYSIFILRF